MPSRTPSRALALLAACAIVLCGCAPTVPTVEGVVIRTPVVDPDAPPAVHPYGSGMLDVFDDVAQFVPGIAGFRSELAADDAAFGARVLAEVDADPDTPVALPSTVTGGPKRGAARAADEVAMGSFLLGGFAGMLVSMVNGGEHVQKLGVGQSQINDDKSLSMTRTDANNLDVEMSQKTEKSSGSGARVKTDFRVKIEGTICPGPDGEFDIRLRVHHQVDGSADGSSGGALEELITSMKGRLGENAFPEQMHLSTSHRSTETRTDGSSITVSTRQQNDSTDLASWFSTAKAPVELIERSKGASDADVKRLTERGQGRAAAMLFGQIFSIMAMWSSGGCVKLDAQAPAVVKPSSTTDIPVNVVTKLGGEDVSAKVSLTLTGKESISTQVMRTPRVSFSYTAPQEIGHTATIGLKAESRRGAASLELKISTGGAHFAITGGSGIFAGTGEWCEGAGAFSVVGAGGTTFFELFGVDGGNLRAAGGDAASGGYDLTGTWTVQTDDKDQPTGIYAQYSGTHYSLTAQPSPYSTSMSFTLTPKETCDAA
ncbi:MAG: hypothetical protein QM598_11960 [Protaetiibacter sp.]